MATPTPPAKGKPEAPAEASPNAAPSAPAPKGPANQQATPQQQGPGGPSKPSGPPSPQGKGPAGPPPGAKGAPSGPPEPPPLEMGPSPDLQQAYQFLNNYLQNMGVASLPPDMVNGGDPDGTSPLNNLGQALPSTVTGDIKSFPKYSLATGAPNSPGLPTGLMPPSRPAFSPQQQGSQQLIGGVPRSQVSMNQRKLKNA